MQYIDGLVQGYSISIANAMEILQSCTKPSIWSENTGQISVYWLKFRRTSVACTLFILVLPAYWHPYSSTMLPTTALRLRPMTALVSRASMAVMEEMTLKCVIAADPRDTLVSLRDLSRLLQRNTTRGLTHWGGGKIAAISQATFSNAFSSMKMYEFRFRFHWNLVQRFELTFLHWFRQWLGTDQVTSHYLYQWWLVYWCIYASFSLKEFKELPTNYLIFYWRKFTLIRIGWIGFV